MSIGTEFAKMVRTNARINARTRDNRDGYSMKADILEAIMLATTTPGYYNEERTKLYHAAYPIWSAWMKHVEGGRIDPALRCELLALSPWKFTALLGEMIDAGITNNGEAEMFFDNMARESRVAA